MQTDLGGEIDIWTYTASYLYAARYGYSDTVLHNDNQIKLLPRQGEGQVPIQSDLWTVPEGRGVEYSDRFGNRVYRSRVVQPHTSLVIATAGQVNLAMEAPLCRTLTSTMSGTFRTRWSTRRDRSWLTPTAWLHLRSKWPLDRTLYFAWCVR